MNRVFLVGVLKSTPEVTKSNDGMVVTFTLVVRDDATSSLSHIRVVATKNLSDFIYANSEPGNVFTVSGKLQSKPREPVDEQFTNYVLADDMELVRKVKIGQLLGIKELLELLPPESVIDRRKQRGKSE